MLRSKSHKRFLKNQQGAVAATYALALIPLIAIAGLGFDYARVAGMDTELQNAADQAALAGSTQLDRRSGSMERSINAVRTGLVSNHTLFASDGTTTNVDVPELNIKFYSNRIDAEAGTNSFTDTTRFAEAGFVSVTVETRSANYSLTPIVGAIKGDMFASAVAGLGSALCRIPPLMVCNPDEGDREGDGEPGAVFDAARAGVGVLVVAGQAGGGGGFWEPGNYGFLDLGNGANAVAEGLGWLGPGGGCTSITGADTIDPEEEIDTEPGLKAGAIDSINTRFDIYKDNSTCKSPGECPSAINVRKDLVRDADDTPSTTGGGKTCKIGNDGWHEPDTDKYEPEDKFPLALTKTPYSMGHPRDMCHAWDNNGDCADGRFGDGAWDRNAYFRTHYIRTENGSGGPSGEAWDQNDWEYNLTHGSDPLPSGTTEPTRYQVYLWELARKGDMVDGVRILDAAPAGATGSTEVRQPNPVCSQEYGYGAGTNATDRRVMTIAVINCTAEEVKGKTPDVQIADWIDVFLVQPSATRTHTDKSDIYFEVIRKTDLTVTGVNNAALIRRDVPYLVK